MQKGGRPSASYPPLTLTLALTLALALALALALHQVTYGATPLSAIVSAVVGAVDDDSTRAPCAVLIPEGDVALAQFVANRSLICAATKEQSLVHKHVVGFVDAIIYTFLPIWMTILLRLVERRPWLHRQGGRSLLIGDVPWVSQVGLG